MSWVLSGSSAALSEIDAVLPGLSPLFRSGVPVWLVGGAVRDLLSNRPPRDLDLLVGADRGTISALIPEVVSVGRTAPALLLSRGRGHSPLQILPLETALPTELARRDFTVNAMALPLSSAGIAGAIVDPFGGQEDLSGRILRRPDRARDPFREDPLRLLRLLRFVSTLGLSVEEETLALAAGAAPQISVISGERRLAELRLFWEGAFLGRVGETLPSDFCGKILRGAIGGKNAPREGSPGAGQAFVRAAALADVAGIFRLWLFAREAWEGERLLWKATSGGSDLPFSRQDRRALGAQDRLWAFYRRWPEAFPPTLSDRALLRQDFSSGALSREAQRILSEAEGERFMAWCVYMSELAERPWRPEGVRSPRSRRR
ncbi:MAG: hypothetical protein ACP5OS_08815 [Leptospirillia bacterium]